MNPRRRVERSQPTDTSLYLRIGSVLAGALIAGEALALLIGMHLLSRPSNPWITTKNDVLLAADIALGLGLVALAAGSWTVSRPASPAPIAALALLTHGYREWEFLAPVARPFCANVPLFVLSNIKLAALLIVVAFDVARAGAT